MSNKVYKGDDWALDFQYKKNGNAMDITGATEIKACVKGDSSDVVVLLSATEITITNAPAGIGVINFSSTKTLLTKKGKQDLQVTLTDANAKETTLILEDFLEIIERNC